MLVINSDKNDENIFKSAYFQGLDHYFLNYFDFEQIRNDAKIYFPITNCMKYFENIYITLRELRYRIY